MPLTTSTSLRYATPVANIVFKRSPKNEFSCLQGYGNDAGNKAHPTFLQCEATKRSLHEYITGCIITARRSYASAVLGVAILSVRPSVCMSVCPSISHIRPLWLIQGTYRWYFYSKLTWKGNHSSCLTPKISAKFQRRYPNGGTKYRWGRLKRRFSTNIWLYLTNGAK